MSYGDYGLNSMSSEHMAQIDTDFIPPNCSISPEEMLTRKHWGVDHFKEIINHTNSKQLLLTPSNWSIIIDCMYQAGSLSGNYRFELLEHIIQITKNTLRTDSDKYRILRQSEVNLMTSKHTGFREYVEALGFKDGITDGRLVMIEPDQQVVNTA
eukprot:848584_1